MKLKGIFTVLFSGLMLFNLMACNGNGQSADDSGSKELTYTITDTAINGAGGTLDLVTKTENKDVYNYQIYWGNKDEAFTDFTSLGKVKAGKNNAKITFEVPDNIAVPPEATHIWAIGYNRERKKTDTAYNTKIPQDNRKTSKKLYEFQILSDHQIISVNDNHDYNRNAAAAYTDIKNFSPNTEMIINNGDIVEYDQDELYQKFFDIIHDVYGDDAPPMYFSVGNHEFTTPQHTAGDFKTDLALWNKYTAEYNGCDDVYFYKVINGSYYIFLGSITSPTQRDIGFVDAVLGKAQLDWLEGVLKEAGKTGKPIFTFLHQPLQDTVSGSLTDHYQEWYGVTYDGEDKRLHDMLDQYPQLLHFSSHSHWHLESVGAWMNGHKEKANFFNTAAVGYLWQGDGGGSSYSGAEGLSVEVYEDYILVRGRSFNANNPEKSKWISLAQFLVELP